MVEPCVATQPRSSPISNAAPTSTAFDRTCAPCIWEIATGKEVLQLKGHKASVMGLAWSADVVVSGLGMLNVPVVPDIPGADRFRGRSFHSSRWDHSKSVAGERVASIGTGASAIQYVPAIAPEVEHLTVFQRSPIWITPRLDQAFTAEEQRRFARVPGAARRHRWKIWWTYERAISRPRAG